VKDFGWAACDVFGLFQDHSIPCIQVMYGYVSYATPNIISIYVLQYTVTILRSTGFL